MPLQPAVFCSAAPDFVPSQQKLTMQIKDRSGRRKALFRGTAQVMFILLEHVTRDDNTIHLNNSEKDYMRWHTKAWERCRCRAIRPGVFSVCKQRWNWAASVCSGRLPHYDAILCRLAPHQVLVRAHATDKAPHFLFPSIQEWQVLQSLTSIKLFCMTVTCRTPGTKPRSSPLTELSRMNPWGLKQMCVFKNRWSK